MNNSFYQYLPHEENNNISLFQSQLYNNGKNLGRTKLCKVINSDSRYKLEWYITEKNISLLEFNTDNELKENGFDVLIYTIKRKKSSKVVKFIIKKAPYLDLNYGCIESSNRFNVPLFVALANTDFKTADLLIKKGADINFSFRHIITEVNEDDIPYIREDFKYCERLEQDNITLVYYRIILADVIKYLCEVNRLNQKNLDYLIEKGYDITNINFELIEKLKKNNKENYIFMLNKAINKKYKR
eukprot:jgi/Orpsp1_1/1179853/evm.model.c7180000071067.1